MASKAKFKEAYETEIERDDWLELLQRLDRVGISLDVAPAGFPLDRQNSPFNVVCVKVYVNKPNVPAKFLVGDKVRVTVELLKREWGKP
jgi:hypothetical protein